MEYSEMKKLFVEIYGGDENDVRIFMSPGRVNLIGEHTDYNGGFVFPAALTMRSAIALRVREDRKIRLAVTSLPNRVEADLDQLDSYKSLEWGNYQLGVASELMKDGYNLVGCDMLFNETIPHGGGLSSSAAIEVATAIALHTIAQEKAGKPVEFDRTYMAQIGQRAENHYVGVNCGIMDQFASSQGRKDHAIFLDCKDLSFKLVPLDMTGCKIVIANTNKKRSLAHSKYNERRSECERAMEQLKAAFPGKQFLGELSMAEFDANRKLVTNPVDAQRAEHVVSECDRVLRSVEALHQKNMTEFGRLMNASHDSLRDLYEVTGVELDTLVEEARKIPGVLGSRMTGAGFGGCTVSLVREEAVDAFIREVGANYTNKVGLVASFYVSEIGDGGREIL